VEAGAGFNGLLVAGMGLLAVGFAFKVGAVPFHMWTPDVYEGAPSPSTAFMAAAVKAASFAAFLRVFLVAFEPLYETWFPVVWWLAALSMVVANLAALAQSNVKRMLAYSSLAHGGYLLVGVAAGNEIGTAAILFYLLVYTVMTIGAFGILMIADVPGDDRLALEEYSGLGWSEPVLGILLTIFLLSLAGFPGTGGFMAKIFLLQGAAESRLWALAVILALTTVVSYYYYLRVGWYLWMRPARSQGRDSTALVPLTVLVALVGCAGALLFLGVFPSGVLDEALAAAQSLGLGVSDALGLARQP
jgi:NADH-quinone oxidoreductase subunit N